MTSSISGWRKLPKHFCTYIRALDDNGNPGEWVYDPATGNSQFTGWCGNPVSYVLKFDDDDNRVREYRTKCDRHRQQVEGERQAKAIAEHNRIMGINRDFI